EEWFKGAMRGDVYYSPGVVRAAGGGLSVIFSAPLRDRASGRLMGVVASWVNWSTLFDEGLARKERFGDTGELLLLDPKSGQVLASGRASVDAAADEVFRAIASASVNRGVMPYTDGRTHRAYLAGWAVESGFGAYAGHRLVAVA